MSTLDVRPRLAFLGLGWIGRNRLEAVVKEGRARVVAIADADAAAVEAARALVPAARVGETLDDLLAADGNQAGIDGVVIATPSAQHARQTAQALEAGAAVYCQKPLSRTGAEAAQLIDLARKRDRLLGVDLCYRHLQATEAVAGLLREGRLGSVYAANLVFHNAYGPDKPWFYDARLSGGGCLIDLGVHLLDLVAYLLDETHFEATSAGLYCQGEPLRDETQTEDFATASLRLGGKISVSITCSWKASVGRDAAIEMSLYGTQGGASITNVGGSFYDFVAMEHRGTQTRTLVEPPDAWGGRSINLWVEQLTRSRAFDPRCQSLLASSCALDQIYALARRHDVMPGWQEERGAVPAVALSAS